MSAAVWGEVANAAIQAGTAWLNSDAQRDANRINIKNSREQREFEERMSNTAVQRRANDIELAGGNRALAFVNGSEATTPTYTPARVEAPHFDAPRFNTAALAQQAQIDNIKAQTYNTSADTRMKDIQADLLEKYGNANSAEELERRAKENTKLAHEIEKAGYEADISRTTSEMLKDKMTQTIELLRQQAAMGKINVESSEAIARTLGVAGKDVGPVSRLFLEIVKQLSITGRSK